MIYRRQIRTDFNGYPSITADVNGCLAESGVREGYCCIMIPHSTAALAITSFWDPRGLDDLVDELGRNIPTRVSYKNQTSPYDASGHVKSVLIGSTAMLPVQNGKLVLGSSQGLVLMEFDGPRTRNYTVMIQAADEGGQDAHK